MGQRKGSVIEKLSPYFCQWVYVLYDGDKMLPGEVPRWITLSQEKRRKMFQMSFRHYKQTGYKDLCRDMELTWNMEDGEFQKLVSLLLLGGANVEI
jgi:hypothetical protein